MARFAVGDKIKFKQELGPYTVRAVNKFYAICTKLVKDRETCVIIDFNAGIRGVENIIYPADYGTTKACQDVLARLMKRQTRISHIVQKPLKIERIYRVCKK